MSEAMKVKETHVQEFLKEYVSLAQATSEGVTIFSKRSNDVPNAFYVCKQDSNLNYEHLRSKLDPNMAHFISLFPKFLARDYGHIAKRYKLNYATSTNKHFVGSRKEIIYFDMDLAKDSNLDLSMGISTWFESFKEELIAETDPLYISNTGNGIHIGYRFSAFCYSETLYTYAYSLASAAFEKILSRICGVKLSPDPKCSDIRRIDRIPGFLNYKKSGTTQSELLYIKKNWVESVCPEWLKPAFDAIDTITSEEGIKEVTIEKRTALWNNSVVKLNLLNELEIHEKQYILSKLNWESLFSKFKYLGYGDISDKLMKSSDNQGVSLNSPFRKETKGSFRLFKNSTTKWFDFGLISAKDSEGIMHDVQSGDILSLMIFLRLFRSSDKYPEFIPLKEFNVNEAITTFGELYEDTKDLTREKLSYVAKEYFKIQADAKGRVPGDLQALEVAVSNFIFSKYEFVVDKKENVVYFNDKNNTQGFKRFPHEASNTFIVFKKRVRSADKAIVGSRDNADIDETATAESIMTSIGFYKFVKEYRDRVVTFIKLISDANNYVSITENAVSLDPFKFVAKSVSNLVFRVFDHSRVIVKFRNEVFVNLSTGEVLMDQDEIRLASENFYHYQDIDYIADYQERSSLFVGKMLTHLVGSHNKLKAFQFVIGQMSVKAHGDAISLFISGDGQNGKSAITRVLSSVLGNDGIGLMGEANASYIQYKERDDSAAAQSQLSKFVGKRLVVLNEINKFQRLDDFFKNLISGEPSNKQYKEYFKDPKPFINHASIIVFHNYGDSIYINSDLWAYARRLLVFNVEKKIETKDIINDIEGKIIAEERDVVWAFIMDSIRFYQDSKDDYKESEWYKTLLEDTVGKLVNSMEFVPNKKIFNNIAYDLGGVVYVPHFYNCVKEALKGTGNSCPGGDELANKIREVYMYSTRNVAQSQQLRGFFTILLNDTPIMICNVKSHSEVLTGTGFGCKLMDISKDKKAVEMYELVGETKGVIRIIDGNKQLIRQLDAEDFGDFLVEYNAILKEGKVIDDGITKEKHKKRASVLSLLSGKEVSKEEEEKDDVDIAI